jgi:hypothetical protein
MATIHYMRSIMKTLRPSSINGLIDDLSFTPSIQSPQIAVLLIHIELYTSSVGGPHHQLQLLQQQGLDIPSTTMVSSIIPGRSQIVSIVMLMMMLCGVSVY